MISIAASVLITKDDKVLLVRETKVDKFGLPGGKLEIGETLRECAIRECQEEAGITPVIDRLVFMSQKPHSREGNNVVRFIFEAHVESHEAAATAELVSEYVDAARFAALKATSAIRGNDVIALVEAFYSGELTAIAEPQLFT